MLQNINIKDTQEHGSAKSCIFQLRVSRDIFSLILQVSRGGEKNIHTSVRSTLYMKCICMVKEKVS